MNNENQIEKMPLDMLNVLLWMSDESQKDNLKRTSQGILLSSFDSLEAAREYRSARESEQFTLERIVARHADEQPSRFEGVVDLASFRLTTACHRNAQID